MKNVLFIFVQINKKNIAIFTNEIVLL